MNNKYYNDNCPAMINDSGRMITNYNSSKNYIYQLMKNENIKNNNELRYYLQKNSTKLINNENKKLLEKKCNKNYNIDGTKYNIDYVLEKYYTL